MRFAIFLQVAIAGFSLICSADRLYLNPLLLVATERFSITALQ
jgi:hypothetical protein